MVDVRSLKGLICIVIKSEKLEKDFDKLIKKAVKSPQNLRFDELCSLCRHFGMKKRRSKSGHRIYKREYPPKFTISIQDDNGKAKPYQVDKLLDKVREHNLYDFEEEN